MLVCALRVCVWIWARTRFICFVRFMYISIKKNDSKWNWLFQKLAFATAACKLQFNFPCVCAFYRRNFFFHFLDTSVSCFWWHSHTPIVFYVAIVLAKHSHQPKKTSFEFMFVYLNDNDINIATQRDNETVDLTFFHLSKWMEP